MEHQPSAARSFGASPAPHPGRIPPRLYAGLIRLVAASFALPPADLRSPSRCSAQAAFARQVAMYLAHVSLGATFSAVGLAFGRDRTTAAHAVRVIEERRDDPRIDAMVDRLERACAAMVDTPPDGEAGAR